MNKKLFFLVTLLASVSLTKCMQQNDPEERPQAVENQLTTITTDQAHANGTTALHIASQHGNIKVAKLLIEKYGADVNKKGMSGWTSLHYAAFGDAYKIIPFLLSKGAKIDAQEDVCGQTPLVMACKKGDLQSVEKLILYGASLSVPDKIGHTILLCCAFNDNAVVMETVIKALEVRKKLKEEGFDVEEFYSNGSQCCSGS